jgi:hypothetical protein
VATERYRDDIVAIKATIARQFGSLNWKPGVPAAWETFAADFFPGASLYPAARPAQRQTVDDFVARMSGLANTTLHTFREAMLGTEIRVFGNVAVAVAACELTENEVEVRHGVEMLLLIKDGAAWRIVAQAWDMESAANPVPARLLHPAGPDL